MKKIIVSIVLISLLTSCSTETTKTVVVDQSGKVIETKEEPTDRLIPNGYISMADRTDPQMFVDTKTGCRYIQYGHSLSPLYDESGHVEGCKKNN
jgi:hypothetical protein